MVVLNETIEFSVKKLRNNLSLTVKEFLKEALDYYIDKKNIEKILKNTEKFIKNKIIEDHFIYINMNDNLCTHKFKRGKRDGEYCCKRITKNGDKSKYICTKHNKGHIPKKKIKKVVNRADNRADNGNSNRTLKGSNEFILCKKSCGKIFKNKNNKNKLKRKNKITIHGEINFKYIMTKLLT